MLGCVSKKLCCQFFYVKIQSISTYGVKTTRVVNVYLITNFNNEKVNKEI